MRKKESLSQDELRLLAKIMVWLPNTTTGDKQELFIPNYTEQALWNQVNANSELCPPDRCAREGCFFFRAKQAAEAAHVIVVNHALLLADIAVNNRAIPEYRYLIVDEAHHLEDNITHQLGFSANEKSIIQLLNVLGDAKTSVFAEIVRQISKAKLPQLSDAESLNRKATKFAKSTQRSIETLFDTLKIFMAEFNKNPNNQYNRKLLISSQMRIQPAWSDVEMAWDNADLSQADLLKLLKKAHAMWDELDSYDVAKEETDMADNVDTSFDIDSLPDEAKEYVEKLEDMVLNLQEEVEKFDSADDSTDESEVDTILKSADPAIRELVEKAMADAAEARETARVERDARLKKDYIEKAAAFENVPLSHEEFGELLKSINEAAPELATKVEEVISSLDKQVSGSSTFEELGSHRESDENADQIAKHVALVKTDNPEMTYEQAYDLALQEHPELYDEYIRGVK